MCNFLKFGYDLFNLNRQFLKLIFEIERLTAKLKPEIKKISRQKTVILRHFEESRLHLFQAVTCSLSQLLTSLNKTSSFFNSFRISTPFDYIFLQLSAGASAK